MEDVKATLLEEELRVRGLFAQASQVKEFAFEACRAWQKHTIEAANADIEDLKSQVTSLEEETEREEKQEEKRRAGYEHALSRLRYTLVEVQTELRQLAVGLNDNHFHANLDRNQCPRQPTQARGENRCRLQSNRIRRVGITLAPGL